jgi:TRAP transporter 4TM/12TM fusion protein
MHETNVSSVYERAYPMGGTLTVLKSLLNIPGLLALGWAIFQIYTVYGPVLDIKLAVVIHVMFATALVFITKPIVGDAGRSCSRLLRFGDYAAVLAALAIAAYFLLNGDRIITRIAGVDPVTAGDVVIGLLTLVLVMEATRRLIGNALVVVILFFLIYQFSGTQLRDAGIFSILAHRGHVSMDFLRQFVDVQILQNEGVFGVPSLVSYTEVFYFLIFGAFLEVFGCGQLFIDLSLLLVGRFRGGVPKVAIVASTLFGSISGSATANAAVMGNFTIPTMKKTGMPAEEAAAVEATASTGGQIMPPVMGAAAFMIAQFLGIPYRDVAIKALIPALAFYFALFIVVDCNAAKARMGAIDLSKYDVSWGNVFRRLYLFIPVVWLVAQIFSGRSLSSSTIEAIVLTVLLALLARIARAARFEGVGCVGRCVAATLAESLHALSSGGRAAVAVAIPCAGAGIIVGVASMTNLGLTFGNFVIALAAGMLVPSLILIMVMILIMGMGMPTTAAYIMGAVLAVPALLALHISPISAHFYVFYFAVLSMVTPPVALAAFVAGGIAGANVWKTGLLAFRNSLSGFLVGYAIVVNPSLLLDGPAYDTAIHLCLLLAGCYGLSVALTRYTNRTIGWTTAIIIGIASVATIVPDLRIAFAGFLCIVSVRLAHSIFRTEESGVLSIKRGDGHESA